MAAPRAPGHRSQPALPFWPARCSGTWPSGGRRMRSRTICGRWARRCKRRRYTGGAMTTAAAAGLRQGRGSCCTASASTPQTAKLLRAGQALCAGRLQAHNRSARASPSTEPSPTTGKATWSIGKDDLNKHAPQTPPLDISPNHLQ